MVNAEHLALQVAPQRALTSRLLSILALDKPDAIAADLLELCSGDITMPAKQNGGGTDLLEVLWHDEALSGVRLKMVFAGWCAVCQG
jgi:hypothetical protein